MGQLLVCFSPLPLFSGLSSFLNFFDFPLVRHVLSPLSPGCLFPSSPRSPLTFLCTFASRLQYIPSADATCVRGYSRCLQLHPEAHQREMGGHGEEGYEGAFELLMFFSSAFEGP